MLTSEQRHFLDSRPVGHLATVDKASMPHVVPVCFALANESVYITIDQKPKRTNRPLQRVKNIQANSSVALVVDKYDDDWTRLGWVMLRGCAEIIESGAEHDSAQRLLRERYPQLRAMRIESLSVIAIRVEKVSAWGNLQPSPR